MAQEKHELDVGGHRFDPTGGSPAMPGQLVFARQPDDGGYHIVQLHKSPTRADRMRLERAHRLRLTEYVAQHGYIEKLTSSRIEKLREDELVRAIVRYEPGFKISPHIGTMQFRTKEREAVDGLLVWIAIFPDGNIDEVLEALAEAGAENLGVIDDREHGGAVRVRVLLDGPDLLAKFANIESVRSIEEIAEQIEDNVNAATTNQSGTAGTSPVWNQGLNGEGQIIGVMDSGPADINHCHFLDAVNNTPSFAHRKVVSLRNANGNAAGSHAT